MTDSPALDAIRVRYATFRELDGAERTRLATALRQTKADEVVLLETCHRVELVAVGEVEPTDAAGRDAVRRVFEVVAGFDSAVVAEEQLIGQVRGAYEAALQAGRSGPILNELFRRALRFGRRVRTHARPGTDRSLADPALAWLVDRLGPRDAVAVVGTGEMGRRLATGLADAGHRVTVVTHSAERGGALLERLPGDGHRLAVGELGAALVTRVAGLVLAVRGRTPALAAAQLGRARPWTLDLSSPPAVDREASALLGERLMTIDELGRRTPAAPVLDARVEARLRHELDEEVDDFAAWLEARQAGAALEVLHREAASVRRRHLERLRGRARLTDEQLAAVEAATAAIVGELLHGPSVELRRGGADADTVRRLFNLEVPG